ncbi:unnamed protein product [Urochloa decumbens]|uniref:MADS-box domain-containing protein n=1 Tax=Urochloa decumbens TaxID=240449 RepID=A0ABC9A542_9POAL
MPRGKKGGGGEGEMTRGKGAPASPTANPRTILSKFAKGKDALTSKAGGLAVNCGVDVAVVCKGPGAAADLDCWPSKEAAGAMVRRYSALAPEQRAAHKEDLAAHLARQLAVERDKLARAREGGVAGALGSWDGSLEGVSTERLRELLAFIEGSLVAAKSRGLKPPAPLRGAADRATLLPGLVHDGEPAGGGSVSATDNRVPPRGEAVADGGGLAPPPPSKNPNAGDLAVAAADAGDEVQMLQPPGSAAAANAKWMRGLVDDLKKRPQPYNPAPRAAGIKYIKVGRSVMELEAYDFIRFDLGMPPPCVAPNSLDGDGEPLRLWSWGNTMPPP